MEKIKIKFEGKSYDAVEIIGACVSDEDFSYDTIVSAEMGLNDALLDCISKTNRHSDADSTDEGIFGFAPKDLILNGSEEELGEYIKGLLLFFDIS